MPSFNCENVKEYADCLNPATNFIESFWNDIFEQLLRSLSTVKSEISINLRSMVDTMLSDMLSVLYLPEWPVVNVFLYGFTKYLLSYIEFSDNMVRVWCIDWIGMVAQTLYKNIHFTQNENSKLNLIETSQCIIIFK